MWHSGYGLVIMVVELRLDSKVLMLFFNFNDSKISSNCSGRLTVIAAQFWLPCTSLYCIAFTKHCWYISQSQSVKFSNILGCTKFSIYGDSI